MPTTDPKQTEKRPLRLRGGRWYANISVRVGSKSRRLRETSGFSEKDRVKAEAWLRRRISEVEDELLFGPTPAAPTKPAIPGFATALADYAERDRGERGPLGKQDLNKLTALAEFFGERRCDELGQDDWNDFVSSELADAAADTVRRWFAMFRAPVRRALKLHKLAFGEFELPAAGEGRAIFLEEDVAHELMSCYAPHAVPIVKTLRYQGCRIGEALRLRLPSDVSLRRETMTFRDTKNHEPRTVPMHDVTARMLREYLGKRDIGPVFLTPQGTAYNDRRLAARGVGYDGSGIRTAHRSALLRYSIRRVLLRTGAVCTHCSGIVVEAPGRSNSARLQLIRPRTKGGAEELQNYRIVCATCAREYPADEPVLTWFRIHDWRHHWASWFMMKGGTETELMALGGWKDPRMVRRYVRLSVEHLRKAVNQV
jgi:integrase